MQQNRRKWLTRIGLAITATGFSRISAFASPAQGILSNPTGEDIPADKSQKMKLGAFSVSLPVKNLKASKEFYEKLGFSVFGGGMDKNYLIMKNGNALIGLFHGMFQKTMLTFNPGWNENAQKLDEFQDVREIQKELKAKGMKLDAEADPGTQGPAHLFITDPDGNPVLVDQHV